MPTGDMPFPLSIIIPVYNQGEFTAQCVRRIWQTTTDPENTRVYVIDNGSDKEDPVEVVGKAISSLGNNHAASNTLVIPMGSNRGFAAAVNRGFQEAPIGDNLFVLNNDVFLDKGWCEGIARTMEDHAGQNIGIVGAKLRFPTGIIQHAGATIASFGAGAHAGGDFDHGQYDDYMECEYVAFAAAFIPYAALEKIGYMDERYFLYYEDVDYCKTAWAKGFKVIYSPHIAAIHYHNQTGKHLGSSNRAYEQASKAYFFEKWQGA